MIKIALLALIALGCASGEDRAEEQCRTLLKIDGKEIAYPRVSKDGKQILFQTNVPGKWQLAVLDVETNAQEKITNDTANNNFPDWSADNSMIAFVSDRDGNEEIYLMNRDGSNLKRITQDKERDIHPYFSPDGKYLLFNSTRGNGSLDLYRYELSTGATLRLTDTEDNETCARYSPDMKQIVFLRNSETSDDVFLMDAENFSSVNLTQTPATRDGWPMFSPDGKWIYYSSMETGIYSIYRIRPDGKEQQQITQAAKGEEDARVYVSPDNKTVVYNKRVGKTIQVMRCELKS